jgi:F0F1-type ATP synthase beta subunit
MKKGKILQVMGPVVDVYFEDAADADCLHCRVG